MNFKRILSLLLAITMCLSIVFPGGTVYASDAGSKEVIREDDRTPTGPPSAARNNGNVAAIGGTEYATLADAFSAAVDGDEITLLLNAVAEEIAVMADVTLNLNGHNVVISDEGEYGFNVAKRNKTFTISGEGTIESDLDGMYGVLLSSIGTKLIIQSGALAFEGKYSYAVEIRQAGCSLEITGGTINMSGDGSTAISATKQEGTISVLGGSIVATGANSTGISATGQANITLDDCSLAMSGSASTAIEFNAKNSTLTVEENAVITSAQDMGIYSTAASGTISVKGQISGKTFAIDNNSTSNITVYSGAVISSEGTAIYNPQAGDVTVNGGHISGGVYSINNVDSGVVSINAGTFDGPLTNTVLSMLKVYGGVFSVDPSNGKLIADDADQYDYVQSGLIAWPNGSGKYQIHDDVTLSFNPTDGMIGGSSAVVTLHMPKGMSYNGAHTLNNAFEKPADPVHANANYADGFFQGWTLNDAVYDFDNPVNSNTTLSAKWGEPVAQIGSVSYPSFATAVAAYQNGEVIILKADAGTFSLPADKSPLQVQKDGHSLTINPPEGGYMIEEVVDAGVTTYTVLAAEAELNGTRYTSLNEAIGLADTGETVYVIKAGTYTLPNLPKNIKIEGKVEGVVFSHTAAGSIASVPNGATFKNVTFNFGNVDYHGFQHAGHIIFDGCTLNGKHFTYGNSTYTNCQFYQSNSDYHMWIYGGDSIVLNGCTFTNNVIGKFLNVYNESTGAHALTVTNCTFINNGSSSKAAINIKETCGNTMLVYDVDITGTNTVQGPFPGNSESDALVVAGNGLYQIDDRKADAEPKLDVTVHTTVQIMENAESEPVVVQVLDTYPDFIAQVVNGEELTNYAVLQNALDAAHELTGNVTVRLLADVDGYVIVRQKAGLNLTIDGAKATEGERWKMAGQIIIDGNARSTGTETLTIQNIDFEGNQSNFYSGTDSFILIPSTKTTGTPYYTGAYNYAHNITIQNVSFTSTSSDLDVVGIKATSGASCYNVVARNVTATNLHSLAQMTSTTGATFDNCTVTESESFLNADGGAGTWLVQSCTFTSKEGAEGYGVRLKGSSSANITLIDNVITATNAFQLGKGGSGTASGSIIVNSGTYHGDFLITSAADSTAKIRISDGVFYGEIKKNDSISYAEDLVKVFGGHFAHEVPQQYCEEDYMPKANLWADTPATPHGVVHAEARIGTVHYEYLTEAIANAVAGDNVELLKNVELDAPLTINKQITLSTKTGNAEPFSIKPSSSYAYSSDSSAGKCLLNVTSAGNLTLKNILVDGDSNTLRVVFVSSGALTIDNATVTGGKYASCAGVYMTGQSTFSMTSGSITGNTINPASDYWSETQDLWLGSEVIATIAGGTVGKVFVNANAYSKDYAILNVSGGAIESVYLEADGVHNAKLNKTGGTITTLKIAQDGNATHTSVETISNPANGNYSALSRVARIGNTYFDSLPAAFATIQPGTAAETNNVTVYLLKDVTLTQAIPVISNTTDPGVNYVHVTLEGNGFKISGAMNANFIEFFTGKGGNRIRNNTSLTLNNVNFENTSAEKGITVVEVDGNGTPTNDVHITFTNCSFKNFYTAAYFGPATSKANYDNRTLTITNCSYDTVTYEYVVDTSAGYVTGKYGTEKNPDEGALAHNQQVTLSLSGNTGYDAEREVFEVARVGDYVYTTFASASLAAIGETNPATTVELVPGKGDVGTFNLPYNETLTVKGTRANFNVVVAEGYNADSLNEVDNHDGTYTFSYKTLVAEVNGVKYANFDDAVTAAGTTYSIKLLANYAGNYTLAEDQTLRIEHNGFTLNVITTAEGKSVVHVVNGAVTTYTVAANAARIGETYYGSLANAIEAVPANGTETTITVLRNITEDVTVPAGKNIVLNLGEYTITAVGQTKESAVITNSGTLTINANTTGGIAAVAIAVKSIAGSTLTVNGGTYRNTYYVAEGYGEGAYLFDCIGANTTATINGITVNQAIKGIRANNGAQVTVRNSTIDRTGPAFGMFAVGGTNSLLTIESGSYKTVNSRGQQMFDLKGTSTIKVLGGAFEQVYTGSGDPIALAVFNNSSNATLQIEGGTFKNAGALAYNHPSAAQVILKGGKFTASEGAQINANPGFLADGYVLATITDTNFAYEVVAASAAEAKIPANETYGRTYDAYYATLAEAVAAATPGETVVLQNNVAIAANGTVVIEKNLTIDLNGKNITATDARALWIKSGDVTITGTGTISAGKTEGSSFSADSSVIRVGNGSNSSDVVDAAASLTIDANVTVSSDHCYGVTVFGTNNTDGNLNTADLTLVVNGTVTVTGSNAAVSGNGNSWNSATAITINGAVSAANDYAIYHPDRGTLTVNGTVSGKGGIEVKAGSVVINAGASVQATAATQSHDPNGNGTSTTGYAIAAVGNPGYPGDPTVTITGGTITGTVIKLAESGSTNYGTVTATSNEITVPEDYKWVEGATAGTYELALKDYVAQVNNGQKYEDLAEAYAATSAGDTLKFLKDIQFTATFAVSKNITLDLNGHILSGKYNKPAITIDGNVIITDSSASGTGMVQNDGNNSQYKAVNLNSGSLTMNAGKLYGGYGLYVNKPASALITGTAQIEGRNAGIWLAGDYSDPNNQAVVTVTGSASVRGTNATNGIGIRAQNASTITVTENASIYGTVEGIRVGLTQMTVAEGTVTCGTGGTEIYYMATCGDWYSEYASNLIKVVENGGTISYIRDGSFGLVNNGKTFTVDLNGHTMTGSFTLKSGFITIEDGTVTGQISVYGSGDSMLGVGAYNHLTIASDAKLTNGDTSIACYNYNYYDEGPSYGSLIDVYGETTNIWVIGNCHSGNLTINIRNGAKVIDSELGIALNGHATVNVYDGATITGETGIEVRAGNLNISGGTITGTGNPPSIEANDSGSTAIGFAVAVSQHATNLPINVHISGGTLSGVRAVYENDVQDPTAGGDINIQISGGSFTGTAEDHIAIKLIDIDIPLATETVTCAIFAGTFSNVVPEAYCADNYIPVLEPDTNGYYTVNTGEYVARNMTTGQGYETLDAAIAEATAGDTVKLLTDIVRTSTITIEKNLILDGEGHTISGTVAAGTSLIQVNIPSNGDFTLKNTKIVPTGNITKNAVVHLNVGGKVTVTGCEFGAETDTNKYMHNPIEFSQSYELTQATVTGNTFYGNAFRNNAISFFKQAENAVITVNNNQFLNMRDQSEAIRISNYTDAHATFNFDHNTYVETNHGTWSGMILIQNVANTEGAENLALHVTNNTLTPAANADATLLVFYRDNANAETGVPAVTGDATVAGNKTYNAIDGAVYEFVASGDNLVLTRKIAAITNASGTTYYTSLRAAIEAVGLGETIDMLADETNAVGISVPSGKNFTVDFHNNTYTVDNPGAGSEGTKTQAFQLLKDSTITFKNGTINLSEENLTAATAPAQNIMRVIQNYADLTLDNMFIDGRNQYGAYQGGLYGVSFNNGTSVVNNTTIMTSNSGIVAFDVYLNDSYTATSVAVTGTSNIQGSVEVAATSAANAADVSLTLTGGTLTGNIVMDSYAENATVTKADAFEQAAPEGYYWKDNGNGTATLKVTVASVKVGEADAVPFDSIEDAFTYANDHGGTVKLHEDVTFADQLDVTGAFTLDLNGKSMTYTGGSLPSGAILVHRGANLTVNDSSTAGTGAIIGGASAYGAIALTHADDAGDALATLTVNGGNITGKYYGIVGNGSRHGTAITVHGGTITGTEGTAIYHPQNGTLTIDGGRFTGGETGIEVRSGTVNITGGTFETTATTYSCNTNGNGTTTVGAAIAIAQHTTNLQINATIQGATFVVPTVEGATAVPISVQNPENNSFSNVEVQSSVIADSEIPAGYYWKQTTANNLYALTKMVAEVKVGEADAVPFDTIEAAFAYANTNGGTLTLHENVTFAAQLDVTGTFTLDLNGKSMTYTGGSLPSGAILVHRGANLTVNDSSTAGTGAIIGGASAYGAIALTHADDAGDALATLTVNGGNITGKYYGIVGNGSRHGTAITVHGGTITGTEGTAIYHPQNGTLTIDGGRFTGGETGIEVRSGTVNITGGTFETTATTYSCNTNGNGTTTVGAAIAIAQHTTNLQINATIQGATFVVPTVEGATAVPISVQNPENNSFSNVEVQSSVIADSEIPAGYYWKQNPTSGLYELTVAVARIGDVYFDTLQAAVNYIGVGTDAEHYASGTIELLRDITLTEAVHVPHSSVTTDADSTYVSVTINGNSHKISGELGLSDQFFTGLSSAVRHCTSLSFNNVAFENTSTVRGGMVVATEGTDTPTNDVHIAFSGCTFKNLYTAAYFNPATAGASYEGRSLSITDSTYQGVTYEYVVDTLCGYTSGDYDHTAALAANQQVALTMTNNSGYDHVREVFEVAQVGNYVYDTFTAAANAAVAGNTTVEIVRPLANPFEYTLAGGASLTVKGETANYTINRDPSYSASSLVSTPNGDNTVTWSYAVSVAEADGVKYPTLNEAIAAVSNNGTVNLLCDASGDGILVPDSTSKNLTIDFHNYTYTVSGSPVGSANTPFQAIHTSTGTLTLKNGTVTVAASLAESPNLHMFLQAHGGVVIDHMTLDGSNVPAVTYSASYGAPWGGTYKPHFNLNNSGVSTITNSTIILANNEAGVITLDDTAKLTIGENVSITARDILTGANDPRFSNTTETSIANGTQLSFAQCDQITDHQLVVGPENGMYQVVEAVIISFNSTGGSAVASKTIQRGTALGVANVPAAPTRANYVFKSWQLNGVDYAFTETVDADITLVATWTEAVVKITRTVGETTEDIYFTSLSDAVKAAADGDYLTVLKDFTIDESKTTAADRIVITKKITIDFGEYTMSVPGSLEPTANWAALFVDADTTLKATTGGIDCLDKEDDKCGVYAVNVRNNAKLTVDSGSYHGGGTIIQAQLGTVEIKGGTFTLTPFEDPYGSSFALNCVDAAYTEGDASFSITGGTFVGFDPQDNASEGDHTDYTAAGYVAILENGAYVVQLGWNVTFDVDGGTPAPVAQRIAAGGKATAPTAPTKENFVFAGWFAGEPATAFDFDTVLNADVTLTAHWTEAVVSITRTVNEESVTTYYASLSDAVNDAENGDTLVILKDFTIGADKTTAADRIVINQPITIDFGAYTMSVPGSLEPTANWAALFVDADTTLKATTGGIDCLDKEDDKCGVYAVNVRNNAKLTVDSGSYHGGGTIIQAQLGTVEIKGGTFTLTPFEDPYGSSFALNCVDAAYTEGDASFSITGGTFVGFDPQDNASEGDHTDYTAAGYVAILENGAYVVQLGWNVTFDVDGGTPAPVAQRIAAGGKATAPTAPTKENFVFAGWFEAGADTAFSFDTVLNADVALTAHWTAAAALNETTGVYYVTLAEAADAVANGQTIKVLSDVTETEEVIFNLAGASFTLDLDGHTVTCAVDLWAKNGTLNLTSSQADGKIVGSANEAAVYVSSNFNDAHGSLTIASENVTIQGGPWGIAFMSNATLNISAGTITANSGEGYAVSGNGDSTGSIVNISGGTITGSELGVYFPGSNALNISGGTITGATGVYVKSGTTTISGTAQIIGNGAAAVYSYYGNGGNPTGDALVVDNCAYPSGAPTVTISAGTFTSEHASGIGSYYGNTETELASVNATSDSITIPDNEIWVANTETGYDLCEAVTVTFDLNGGDSAAIPTQKIAKGAKATKPADPTKTGYTFAVWKNGTADFNFETDAVTENITLVAQWTVEKYTVTVTSSNNGSFSGGQSIAMVTGGGTFDFGTVHTVYAPTVSGYDFLGWFSAECTPDSPLSTAHSFNYTVRAENNELVAVYKISTQVTYHLTITGSKFTVNGGTVQRSRYAADFTGGSQITVEFVDTDGKTFLYWIDGNGVIVSPNDKYTFTLNHDTVLEAVYTDANPGTEALVVFLSDKQSQQILMQQYFGNTEPITFPTAPSVLGYNFTEWQFANGASATEEAIHAAMATNTRIELYPAYAAGDQTYHVYLHYQMYGQTGYYKTYDMGNYTLGDMFWVTSGNKANGKYFSYFTDTEGNILGYNKYIKIRPTGDVELVAVFGASYTPTAVSTVANAFATTSGDKGVVNFTVNRSLPTNYTLVESGVLYAKTESVGTDPENLSLYLVLNSTNGSVVRVNFAGNAQVDTMNFYIKTATKDTSYVVRGFLIVKDGSGATKVIYSDQAIWANYNALSANGSAYHVVRGLN